MRRGDIQPCVVTYYFLDPRGILGPGRSLWMPLLYSAHRVLPAPQSPVHQSLASLPCTPCPPTPNPITAPSPTAKGAHNLQPSCMLGVGAHKNSYGRSRWTASPEAWAMLWSHLELTSLHGPPTLYSLAMPLLEHLSVTPLHWALERRDPVSDTQHRAWVYIRCSCFFSVDEWKKTPEGWAPSCRGPSSWKRHPPWFP